MKNNPQRYLEEWTELPNGFVKLILSVVAASVAVFAHRQLRREAGVD
jgi:hypothetical protein